MAASERAPGPAERHTLEHFVAWCLAFLVLDNGLPFTVEAFQRRILADFFGAEGRKPVKETLCLLPSSNGKTTLFAAVALYHLVFTPYARVHVAAASKKQAGILYEHICGFVERTDQAEISTLGELVLIRRGSREIRHRTNGGLLEVLAADSDTADGNGSTLALVDELHRHKTDGMYAVLRKGLKKRNGQMVTISTAGSDEDTPLGRMRAKALKFPVCVRLEEEKRTYARAPRGNLVLHEWSLDPDDPLDDMALVKLANPASFVTLDHLADEHETSEPWNWARFACNVWTLGEESAIDSRLWRARAHPGARIPDGAARVWLGADLGWKWDTTALVPLWDREPDHGPRLLGVPWILTPPRNGESLEWDVVWGALCEAAKTWPLAGLVIDPNAGGEQLATEARKKLKLTVVEHSQANGPMALAAQRFTAALRDGTLEHPEDDQLTRQVLVARARIIQGAGDDQRDAPFVFEKPRGSKGYIDGLIAASMVHSVVVADQPKPRPKPRFEVLV